MKIFFSKYKVEPTRENEKYDLVEGALAHCWIKADNPQSAHAKAEFFVVKGDWKITEIQSHPFEVNESNFIGKDLGIEHYLEAKSEGLSIVYAGWARDRKTTAGPFQLKPSFKFSISKFIDSQKNFPKEDVVYIMTKDIDVTK
jgi:hypothetical protein